jgi:hypothetical protein
VNHIHLIGMFAGHTLFVSFIIQIDFTLVGVDAIKVDKLIATGKVFRQFDAILRLVYIPWTLYPQVIGGGVSDGDLTT